MQTMRNDFWAAATLAVLLAALNGCGKTEHTDSATAPARHAAKVSQGAAALALANMVSAVGTGKPYADIELKFDLRARPVVGEPVDIDLALIPTQDLERVSASFQAVEGIELTRAVDRLRSRILPWECRFPHTDRHSAARRGFLCQCRRPCRLWGLIRDS